MDAFWRSRNWHLNWFFLPKSCLFSWSWVSGFTQVVETLTFTSSFTATMECAPSISFSDFVGGITYYPLLLRFLWRGVTLIFSRETCWGNMPFSPFCVVREKRRVTLGRICSGDHFCLSEPFSPLEIWQKMECVSLGGGSFCVPCWKSTSR